MSDAQDVEGAAEDSVGMSTEEDVEANIEAALHEFLDTLDESETYQRFVAADEALQDDDDAMALLREYQRKQQQMQRGGFDESVMAELKQLQTEMSNNETIRRQQAAQTELVELLKRTNDAISDEIGEEFARSTGGGCC
ncbi:halo-CC-star protein HcsL [Halorubrum ezzemoulense]|uniref:Halo-CC-star protein HcsL n=1 Tax=Halorubrum ezzemoulense TaxID=337243 RepID=A0ABT4Z899_HALEZ|nr:halo-CC-star protein HcsL [Halorubrum ezzemoulense]MDB2239526.1 halo-CC-star protein HcsL [Halorubrum ezzemoulense]MDB2242964.1 halo-CC-star protein HcsL [Halorubrum ezzemoulense]MDB2246484.1 halo-CC-star protein HcsL [Halorubrum ezzemoulense]MDB2249950.1 halo-CC-star protein HcsL [Halorubrum ezzemoulense]MDB2253208.1 halo-CC-star protein HcsL [Halorubrum ezzemoulense]